MTLATHTLPPFSPFSPPSDHPADYLLPVPDFDVREYVEADALQQRQNDVVLHPLAVGTPVIVLRTGRAGVIHALASGGVQRAEVQTWNSHFSRWDYRWLDREQFVEGTAAAQ